MKRITLLVTLIFTAITFAQIPQHRNCGMEAHMNLKLQDPEYAAKYYELQGRFQTNHTNNNFLPPATYLIPVAVHFPEANESNRACLEALAQTQVDILNDDFGGTNADLSNWSSASTFYPGINTGAVSVRFELATLNHPAGTDPDLVEGGPAVTIGYNFGGGGDSDSNWAGYFNFLVKDIGGGLLGYSPLGGIPSNGDSVVMNIFAFGSGAGCPGYVPGAPYDLGRTVTHEVGHHLNLPHTWGNGGCSSDDGVSDTPNIDGPSYSCPADGSVTMCGNTSLTMNFMDYVNDACMYMITEGQANRVTTYLDIIYPDYNQDTLTTNDFATNSFSIYPNPVNKNTNKFVNITMSTAINPNDVQVTLFQLEGKKMSIPNSIQTENNIIKLDTSKLSSGLYFVKIKNGLKEITKKLIIE